MNFSLFSRPFGTNDNRSPGPGIEMPGYFQAPLTGQSASLFVAHFLNLTRMRQLGSRSEPRYSTSSAETGHFNVFQLAAPGDVRIPGTAWPAKAG
jgi:hypothetical protein